MTETATYYAISHAETRANYNQEWSLFIVQNNININDVSVYFRTSSMMVIIHPQTNIM
jgi:hypothetical protein